MVTLPVNALVTKLAASLAVPPRYRFPHGFVALPKLIAPAVPGSKEALIATPDKLLNAWFAPDPPPPVTHSPYQFVLSPELKRQEFPVEKAADVTPKEQDPPTQ